MTTDELNKELLISLKSKKTNHILHFLLSLVTVGLWIIPWIIISSNNSDRNRSVRSEVTGEKDYFSIVMKTLVVIIGIIIIAQYI